MGPFTSRASPNPNPSGGMGLLSLLFLLARSVKKGGKGRAYEVVVLVLRPRFNRQFENLMSHVIESRTLLATGPGAALAQSCGWLPSSTWTSHWATALSGFSLPSLE